VRFAGAKLQIRKTFAATVTCSTINYNTILETKLRIEYSAEAMEWSTEEWGCSSLQRKIFLHDVPNIFSNGHLGFSQPWMEHPGHV